MLDDYPVTRFCILWVIFPKSPSCTWTFVVSSGNLCPIFLEGWGSFDQDVNKEVMVLIRTVSVLDRGLIIGLLAPFEAVSSMLVGHAVFL